MDHAERTLSTGHELPGRLTDRARGGESGAFAEPGQGYADDPVHAPAGGSMAAMLAARTAQLSDNAQPVAPAHCVRPWSLEERVPGLAAARGHSSSAAAPSPLGGQASAQAQGTSPAAAALALATEQGTRIDLPDRDALEAHFGRSLGQLEVFVSAEACQSVNSGGFAVSNQIVLPSSEVSQAVVAEEVAHALQQGGDQHAVVARADLATTDPHSSVEREAAAAATAFQNGTTQPDSALTASGVVLARTPPENPSSDGSRSAHDDVAPPSSLSEDEVELEPTEDPSSVQEGEVALETASADESEALLVKLNELECRQKELEKSIPPSKHAENFTDIKKRIAAAKRTPTAAEVQAIEALIIEDEKKLLTSDQKIESATECSKESSPSTNDVYNGQSIMPDDMRIVGTMNVYIYRNKIENIKMKLSEPATREKVWQEISAEDKITIWVINGENYLAEGNHRWFAAKEMGIPIPLSVIQAFDKGRWRNPPSKLDQIIVRP